VFNPQDVHAISSPHGDPFVEITVPNAPLQKRFSGVTLDGDYAKKTRSQ